MGFVFGMKLYYMGCPCLIYICLHKHFLCIDDVSQNIFKLRLFRLYNIVKCYSMYVFKQNIADKKCLLIITVSNFIIICKLQK